MIVNIFKAPMFIKYMLNTFQCVQRMQKSFGVHSRVETGWSYADGGGVVVYLDAKVSRPDGSFNNFANSFLVPGENQELKLGDPQDVVAMLRKEFDKAFEELYKFVFSEPSEVSREPGDSVSS